MRWPLLLIAAFLFTLGLTRGSSSVWAQFDSSSTPTVEEATPVQTADEAEFTEEMVAEITDQYFADVEIYRESERRYELAQQDYYNLNTLASLEEAIRRARDLLRSRADVLEDYFTYLRANLQLTKGIDLQDKEIVDAELEFWQGRMRRYRADVATLESRPAVNDLFVELNNQERAIYNAVYSALALTKIGELQTAIDTGYIVRDRILMAIEQSTTLSAADKAIKRRGIEEVDRLLQRARNNMIDVQLDYRIKQGQAAFTIQSYSSFQAEAEFSYLQLRQAHSFMKEIARDL